MEGDLLFASTMGTMRVTERVTALSGQPSTSERRLPPSVHFLLNPADRQTRPPGTPPQCRFWTACRDVNAIPGAFWRL